MLIKVIKKILNASKIVLLTLSYTILAHSVSKET